MLVLLLLILFLSILQSSAEIYIVSLNGEKWTAENSNKSIQLKATVPGGIYTDLQQNNVINDPYYGFNDMEYRWIAYDNWTYTSYFEVTKELMMKKNIWLVCDGVDTVSQIFINNNGVMNTSNMFVQYVIDIKPYVKMDNNTIEVAFESPVLYALRRSEEHKTDYGYHIPPSCPSPVQHGECHINFIRKVPSSFSWDWGPAFPSVGIWKPLRIIALNSAIIQDVTVNYYKGNDAGPWQMNITTYLTTGTTMPLDGIITLQFETNQLEKPVVLLPNENGRANVSIIWNTEGIPITLWWPNGYGSQTLYNLSVTFRSADGSETSLKQVKIGFRTLEIIQDSVLNSTGLTFYFKINDIPIFMKGSNWIPADSFPERTSDSYVRNLLKAAKYANMNMLRVWGGGRYESDSFYSIADEFGILIWHDLMFACSMYPVTEDFLASIATEVMQQVQRIQHHASIAVWGGNNENEAALAENWYFTNFNFEQYKMDYIKLYVGTIMPLMQMYDIKNPYIISSPSNGLETIEEGYIAKNPKDPHFGDMHFYNYVADGWDWTSFPRPRFASEYGYQSWPSFETVSRISEESDWSYSSSFADHRQHHFMGNFEMMAAVNRHLPIPEGCDNNITCNTPDKFKAMLYLTQVHQAVSVKTETEHYRRARSALNKNSEGLTMGALYWQLNDIWQAPSWSSIEFGGKWKMLHYFAVKFFAPVLVSPYIDMDILRVYVINDLLQDITNACLNISVYRWNSFAVQHYILQEFYLEPSSVMQVFEIEMTSLFNYSGCQRSECFVYTCLSHEDGNQLGPCNTIFPTPLFEAEGIEMPNISISNVIAIQPLEEDVLSAFQFDMTAISVAVFVQLEAIGIHGRFSDNGFLMMAPLIQMQFYAWEEITKEQFESSLQVMSLFTISQLSTN